MLKLAEDIKMNHLKVPDRSIESNLGQKHDYELPDGTTLHLDAECVYLPDQMFKLQEDNLGIHQMIMNSINGCDTDIKKELYNGIVVTGGNTLFPGFVDRLNRNINTPNMYKLKLIASNDSSERKFSSWTGGSILGSLGSMHAMWVSKAEFEEFGPAIVEKKCP